MQFWWWFSTLHKRILRYDIDKYNILTNKNSKYLFYWYNGFLKSKNIEQIKTRPTKISEDSVRLVKIQERDW